MGPVGSDSMGLDYMQNQLWKYQEVAGCEKWKASVRYLVAGQYDDRSHSNEGASVLSIRVVVIPLEQVSPALHLLAAAGAVF